MKQKGRFYFSIKSGWGKIEPSLRFSGFTLIELIIVVVIVGILASFAVPQFAVTKERALDREAKATLALMRAAGRIYRMEFGSGAYYPVDNSNPSVAAINTDLKLSLPTAASPNWNYSVSDPTSGVNRAARTGRTWSLNSSGDCENPACAGPGCPGPGGCT